MSIHLSSSSKNVRSPSTFVQIPPAAASSSSSPPMPPVLDAALMTVVQKQLQSRASPTIGFDRNQCDKVLVNYGSFRASVSSSPTPSPKLPKAGTIASGNNNGVSQQMPPLPPPSTLPPTSSATSSSSNCQSQNQHHVPLLTTHPFIYNPMEPCIFPIAIPPGFPSGSPDFIRLFAPNMAAVAAAAANQSNQSGANFVTNSNGPQGLVPNSRSTTQSNNTNTSSEQHAQNLQHRPPSTSSAISRHQQSHYRHKQHYPTDSHQFQQTAGHTFHHQQRTSQTSYAQQQHNRTKACYTCGDFGHLAFACPEQYLSDSNYSHNNRGKNKVNNNRR